MERLTRKPFQGVTNIIRFNWHFFMIGFGIIAILFFAKSFFNDSINVIAAIIIIFAVSGMAISLVVSWYVYDHTGLYSLNWLNTLDIGPGTQLVNINAGFDETSWALKEKYPASKLLVFDFYDPGKHTEISIERARKIYSVYPGTKAIDTGHILLPKNSVDNIFLILSAHEIRKEEERITFFKQLKQILKDNGKIIVVEHQRDLNNFLAYNVGCFHFHSHKTWEQTFLQSGFTKISEIKLNPFISAFTLQNNGITT